MTLFKTIEEVLSIPSVSYFENWFINNIIKRFENEPKITIQQDGFKNTLIKYNSEINQTFTFQSHIDHPGFIHFGNGRVRAVGKNQPLNVGEQIRFFKYPNDIGDLATILEVNKKELIVSLPINYPFAIGLFDYKPLDIKKDTMEGRSFDDTLSSALLVYMLELAIRKNYKNSFSVLFTKAEEEGEIGALVLDKNKLDISKNMITVEIMADDGQFGNGIVFREGDLYSKYDPELYFELTGISSGLKRYDDKYNYQIIDNHYPGKTEAFIFSSYGYKTIVICMATKNKHNNDRSIWEPKPEIVSKNDLLSMAKFLNVLIKKE